MSLDRARAELAEAVEEAIPPHDPLYKLMGKIDGAMAALEAAESRLGQDAVDRLARAAALGAREHALALVRVEMRKLAAWIAALLVLVGAIGFAAGWLLARSG